MSAHAEVNTVTKVRIPPQYKVYLLNDDFTPMDFVVQILQELFHHSHSEAYKIMMNIHNNGKGLAGIYVKEIAEQKRYETNAVAQQNGHPLKAVVEQV